MPTVEVETALLGLEKTCAGSFCQKVIASCLSHLHLQTLFGFALCAFLSLKYDPPFVRLRDCAFAGMQQQIKVHQKSERREKQDLAHAF